MTRLGRAPGLRDRFRRAVRGLGWLALAGVIAVSGAGLVVGLDHPATGAARPELTARGDAAFATALPPVRAALGRSASAADALAVAGREASAALRASDAATAEARLVEGDVALRDATVAAVDLAAARDALLAQVGDARLGAATRDRLVSLQAALDAVAQLPDAWASVRGSTEPRLTEGLIGIEGVRGTLSEATAALD